jgi:hypothetical protein
MTPIILKALDECIERRKLLLQEKEKELQIHKETVAKLETLIAGIKKDIQHFEISKNYNLT